MEEGEAEGWVREGRLSGRAQGRRGTLNSVLLRTRSCFEESLEEAREMGRCSMEIDQTEWRVRRVVEGAGEEGGTRSRSFDQ